MLTLHKGSIGNKFLITEGKKKKEYNATITVFFFFSLKVIVQKLNRKPTRKITK